MLKTIPGTFKAGVVELGEPAAWMPEGPVLVTFLAANSEKAVTPPLTPEQAAEMRGRLAAWKKDWDYPGMTAYDDLAMRENGAESESGVSHRTCIWISGARD